MTRSKNIVLGIVLILLGLFALNYLMSSKSYTQGYLGHTEYAVVSVERSTTEGSHVEINIASLNVSDPFNIYILDENLVPVTYKLGTPLKYWIQNDADMRPMYVWFKVPELAPHSSFVFYVKKVSDTTSDLSDPYDVFYFFDDFIDNRNLWSRYNCGISSGRLVCNQGGSDYTVETAKQIPMYGIRVVSFLKGRGTYNGGFDIGISCTMGGNSDGVCFSNNMYLVAFSTSDGYYRIYVRPNGQRGWTKVFETPYSFDSTNPHIVDIRVSSDGTIETYVDGSLAGQPYQVTGLPDDGGYLAVREWQGEIYWLLLTHYDPNVTYTVEDVGGYYKITVINNTDNYYSSYAVPVRASDIGVTSIADNLYPTTDVNTLYAYLPDAEYGYWTRKTLYLLFGGSGMDTFSASVPSPYLTEANYTLEGPYDINVGDVRLSIGVDDINAFRPGNTVDLQVHYNILEGNLVNPNIRCDVGTASYVGPYNDLNIPYQVPSQSEGVYSIEITCHGLFMPDRSFTVLYPIIDENLDEPYLHIQVLDYTSELNGISDGYIHIRVVDDQNNPVPGAEVWISYPMQTNYGLYTNDQGELNWRIAYAPSEDWYGLAPGDYIYITARKDGYHPAGTVLFVSQAQPSEGGGEEGGETSGTTGAAGGVPPSTPTTSPQPTAAEVAVQPAAPTAAGGVPLTVVIGVLVVLALLYYLSRR